MPEEWTSTHTTTPSGSRISQAAAAFRPKKCRYFCARNVYSASGMSASSSGVTWISVE